MPNSIEDRVRDLERFRYSMLGRVNACQTMIVDLWWNHLRKHVDDPVATTEDMRRVWLAAADMPSRRFLGVDPAELEMISQEYRDALDHLSRELLDIAKNAESK